MKKVYSILRLKTLSLLLLLSWLPAVAQITRPVLGIVDDMHSTSRSVCAVQSDSAACDYRVWTPARNGYRVTEAGAERPTMVGDIRSIGAERAAVQYACYTQTVAAMAAPLSEIGAISPYEDTPAEMSRPRRVRSDGGIGEPGALPVGDVPYLFFALCLAAYWLSTRRKKA